MAKRKRTGNLTFSKRATLWLPFEGTIALVTAGTVVQSADLLGNYFGQTGAELPVGATIGPIRGRWSLRPDISSTGNVENQVEALMQLVPEGGRATVPTPGVDILDAMWYGQMFSLWNEVETSSGVFGTISGREEPFETKAMRKLTGNGQELKISAVQSSNTDYDLKFLGVIFVRLP